MVFHFFLVLLFSTNAVRIVLLLQRISTAIPGTVALYTIQKCDSNGMFWIGLDGVWMGVFP